MAVERPGDGVCEADAIGIDIEECALLGGAECECVDAHLTRARPVATAGVVAGALHFEEARGQMAHSVTPEQGRRARGFAQERVERAKDFGVGARAVGEMPVGVRQFRCHLKAPAAEQIVSRKIVFEELVSPAAELAHVASNLFGCAFDRRIERAHLLSGEARRAELAFEQPIFGNGFAGCQRPEP